MAKVYPVAYQRERNEIGLSRSCILRNVDVMAMSSSDEDSGEENSTLSSLLTTADRLLDVAEHGQVSFPTSKLDTKFRSLEERLLELHIEESAKAVSSSHHHLNPCSNLVSLLCRKDRCNRLLVTLLPNNEGYSVHVLITGGGGAGIGNPQVQEVELFRLPYEDDDFLSYLDNEELPTSILDLLEKAWSELFYSGCVIAEIRDNRRIPASLNNQANTEDCAGLTSHVLLRPTTQSIICDGKLICERSGWTTREERAMVESQLCLATQGPLCLDPNPVVSLMAKKSCVRRQKFATPAMRRHAKMFSQAGLNRKRKLEETAGPPELHLHDFLQKRPNHKNNAQEMLQQHQAMMKASLRSIIQGSQPAAASSATPVGGATASAVSAMTTPANDYNLVTDVSKHARAIQKRADVNDMTPHIVEEYILETAERGANRIYHTKLTIYQRLANEEYLGELYVERDFNERDKKGSTCRFVLGTRPHALRYINQFTEIFTEEGRKPVKITHLVPNQKPRITFTPGMRERMNERAAAVAAANAARATLTNASNASSPSSSNSSNSNNLNSTVPNVVNNGIKKQVSLSVSVAAGQPQIQPSILQQTLSAPSGSQACPPPIPTAVVRSATVMHQPPSVQLPQTPHPPPQQLPDNVVVPAAGAATATENSNSGEQEMAISAIMQSLMKDSAQFEVENKQQQQQQAHPPQAQPQSQIGLNQLPTCPVPQASLGNLCNSSSTSPVKLPTTPQSPSQSSASSSSSTLLAKRVSLKNLLSAQAAQNSSDIGHSNSPIKSPVKVTMSQLAAQLSRPVTITSNLPSYTQAIAEQKGTSQQQQQTSQPPRQRLIVTTQQPPVSNTGKLESPNLQALLGSANVNAANTVDNVIPVELGNANNPSLLERLVSGQPITSNSSPAATANPVAVNANRSSSTDNEITLAALLSKPPVQNLHSPSTSSVSGSPTKASPLIQQLQQPIPQQTARGTPIQLPQSPRQQSSPRINNLSASPRAGGHTGNSMQPPQHLQPQPPQHLQMQSHPAKIQQAPAPGNAELPNGHNGSNMVSLQNLLQSGMAVQVSQHPATQTSSSSIPVQFNIPGLSAPVTLSVNVQDQQQQLQSGNAQPPQLQSHQQQPQVATGQKLVPTSTVMTSASGGTVLIPQGSNIIQLPQQPINMRTQTVQLANANNLLKAGTAQVVQVRGSQPPLYVQMPVTSAAANVSSVPGAGGGQSILVRSVVDQRQQPFSANAAATAGGAAGPPQQQLILNSVKSQPSLIALSQQQQLPQQPVVLQANNTTAVLSAQPQSRQVAIQLQEQPLTQAATAKMQVASGNQRMRQQRKQSLK